MTQFNYFNNIILLVYECHYSYAEKFFSIVSEEEWNSDSKSGRSQSGGDSGEWRFILPISGVPVVEWWIIVADIQLRIYQQRQSYLRVYNVLIG